MEISPKFKSPRILFWLCPCYGLHTVAVQGKA